MTMQKKTVVDVEGVLIYLLEVLSSARAGDTEELDEGAYAYARDVLEAAELPLKDLGMYGAVEDSIDESERLILVAQFDEADQLLLETIRNIMEKSGTNARLQRLYT